MDAERRLLLGWWTCSRSQMLDGAIPLKYFVGFGQNLKFNPFGNREPIQVTQYRRNVLKRFSLNSSSSVYNTLQFIKLLFREPESETVAKVNFTCSGLIWVIYNLSNIYRCLKNLKKSKQLWSWLCWEAGSYWSTNEPINKCGLCNLQFYRWVYFYCWAPSRGESEYRQRRT